MNSTKELEAIWAAVADQPKPKEFKVPSNFKPIFRKVYSGPGYPVEERTKKQMLIDSGFNLKPTPPLTIDRRPLRLWLAESVN